MPFIIDESNPDVDSMNRQNGTRRRYRVRRFGLFHHLTLSLAQIRAMISSEPPPEVGVGAMMMCCEKLQSQEWAKGDETLAN